MFEDVMILGNGHSMLVGHKPNKITEKTFSEDIFKNAKVDESISSFGLFGGSINYNTFYPDLKPEDITPQDADFIEPVYRMLSECIVGSYYPTDFSRNNVLRDSMSLLIGQTVNCDHETEVGNAIGAVRTTAWQEAYKIGDLDVPAGINGYLKIDAKSNPRLARGIMMDPPSIHSNSVTVKFTWEPSHPNMDINEFYNKMGSYDADGNLICRVATKIISYMETSLVSAGADPFAKQIRDGKIVLPESANGNYSFSANPETNSETPYFYMDYKDITRMDTIHNTMVFTYDKEKLGKQHKSKTKNNMNELETFLASLFSGEGLLTLSEGATANRETVTSLISGMVTEVAQLRASNDQLTTDLAARTQELADEKLKQPNAEMVSLGETALTSLRNQTVENYKKLMGDKSDPALLSLLQNSNHTSLVTFNATYEQQLEEKFPVTCSKCGSHEVSRATASVEVTETEENQLSEVPSTVSAIDKLRNGKLSTGSTL